MMEDVDLGLKTPATISLEIVEKVMMVTEDVDIFPRLDTLPTHNTGEIGRSLCFYVYGHARSVNSSQTIHLYSYNHDGIYICKHKVTSRRY